MTALTEVARSKQDLDFSTLAAFFDTWAHVALRLPGDLLEKGDRVSALVARSWFPGHAALYLGTEDAGSDGNDGHPIVQPVAVEGGAALPTDACSPGGTTSSRACGRTTYSPLLPGSHA